MAQELFHLSIILPTKRVFEGEVSEVVLPANDGEAGVLARHENFVGILGTGPLKYISQGKDYWLAVGSGIFKIVGNKMTVLAEVAERGEEIVNVEDSPQIIKELEAEMAKKSQFSSEFNPIYLKLQREKAKLEVHRRTNLLN